MWVGGGVSSRVTKEVADMRCDVSSERWLVMLMRGGG